MDPEAMVRSMRPSGRLLAATMAIAVIVLSSATCLLAVEMTPAQKACCAAMNHDCGEMALETGCCPSESPSLISLAAASLTPQVASADCVAVSVGAANLIPPVDLRTVAAFDSSAPRYSSRSTHLLVSVFRL